MTNPYAPPRSVVQDIADPTARAVLADRGARLGATILDGFAVALMVYLPAGIGMIVGGLAGGEFGQRGPSPYSLLTGFAAGFVGFAVWCWLTVKYVRANGQSIGKKLLRIKVTRTDGSPISLARLFWMRNFLNGLLGIIPLYGFIDALVIFGDARECIHDKIAGTIVVKA